MEYTQNGSNKIIEDVTRPYNFTTASLDTYVHGILLKPYNAYKTFSYFETYFVFRLLEKFINLINIDFVIKDFYFCMAFPYLDGMNIQMITASALSLQSRYTSPSKGTFFSLFHKHRRPSVLSSSKQSYIKSPENSIQNEHSESILSKIRMSSLASVASSMNIPSERKINLEGNRQQRRTGRRNDKFLSLWGDHSVTTEVNYLIAIVFIQYQ